MASIFDQRSGSSASLPRGVAGASSPYIEYPAPNPAGVPLEAGAYGDGGAFGAYEDPYQRFGDAPVGVDPAFGVNGSVYAAPAPKPARARSRSKDPRRGQYYRRLRNLVFMAILALLVFVGYVLVVHSPIFEIQEVTANPTAHVSSEEISEFAAIPAGSTLYGFDAHGIEERIMANPWVSSVSLTRIPPHTLAIEVKERTAAGVVMLSNGAEAWIIATDGYWVETVPLEEATAENGLPSPSEQARNYAKDNGLVYVSGISALIKPQVGIKCDDAAVLGVMEYLDSFTGALRVLIDAAKAPTAESISIVLTNGIEVSLGAPEDIALKERVIMGLLEVYVGQMTYINVRTPVSPVWRGLDAAVAGSANGENGAGFDSVSFATESDYAEAEAAAEQARREQEEANRQAEYANAGILVGTAEGGPGGPLDWGGYYSDSGDWIYAYYDANGNWINGYYDASGIWVRIS